MPRAPLSPISPSSSVPGSHPGQRRDAHRRVGPVDRRSKPGVVNVSIEYRMNRTVPNRAPELRLGITQWCHPIARLSYLVFHSMTCDIWHVTGGDNAALGVAASETGAIYTFSPSCRLPNLTFFCLFNFTKCQDGSLEQALLTH